MLLLTSNQIVPYKLGCTDIYTFWQQMILKKELFFNHIYAPLVPKEYELHAILKYKDSKGIKMGKKTDKLF